jgi:hypothetical protein
VSLGSCSVILAKAPPEATTKLSARDPELIVGQGRPGGALDPDHCANQGGQGDEQRQLCEVRLDS